MKPHLRRVLVALGIGAVMALASPSGQAMAWKPVVTVSTICAADKTWTAQWTVANNEHRSSLTVDSLTLTPTLVPVPGGLVAGDELSSGHTGTVTVQVPNGVTPVALSVAYTFTRPQEKPTAVTVTVVRPRGCTVPSTSPSGPAPSSPAASASASPVPSSPAPAEPSVRPTQTVPNPPGDGDDDVTPTAPAPIRPGTAGGGPTLPVTGPQGLLMAGSGAALVSAGVLALVLFRRSRRRFTA